MSSSPDQAPQVILGNSNKRFSGVTSTLLATLPAVQKHLPVPLAVLAPHHLPDDAPTISFWQFVRLCHREKRTRVFHARRNDEMIQALLARHLFRCPNLKILFTSTAQRYHSGFTRFLMRQMDGIITTCSAAASYLRTPADHTVPHGIDLERYYPPDSKSDAWKTLAAEEKLPGRYGIGIFGRIRPSKGIDLFVEAVIAALPDHPDFTAVIVGETTPSNQTYQDLLQRKIGAAGLSNRIVFLGKQPADRLPFLFRAMTLVCALSRNEGFGLTVLEAMASGNPVLASEAGAWKDIVEPSVHGALVPIDDLAATKEAMHQLLRDPDTLRTSGEAARRHVEHGYSIDDEGRALANIYLQYLSE